MAAISFDSAGGQSFKCKAGTLVSHTFNPGSLKADYSLKGQCQEISNTEVSNRWYKVTASWDGNAKMATENISVTVSNGHYAGSLSMYCPADPWINAVNCTLSGKAGDIFTYFKVMQYPISGNFVTQAQRQALLAEWNQPAANAAAQVPVIQVPAEGQKHFVPVTVQLKIQHNPAYGVLLQFRRAELTSPPNVPNLYAKQSVVLKNSKTSAGVTSAELRIEKPGKWQVRAQGMFPAAPWSNWRNFSVGSLVLGTPPQLDLKP